MTARRRVGFYGGSFDPPHLQHQATALYAMECANISELIVAPIFIHPDGKAMAPFIDRVRMTAELMDPLRAVRPIRVSMIEEEVAKLAEEASRALPLGFPVGRTIETMRHLLRRRSSYADVQIVLVLGTDIRPNFPRWSGAEGLLDMVLAGNLEIFWVDRAVDLSSTQVRARIKAGLSTDRMIAPRTRKFIDQKGLYL